MDRLKGLQRPPIPQPLPAVNIKYKKQRKIGQGVYGTVYSAAPIPNPTNATVALKTIGLRNPDAGFPVTAVREIGILKELSHKNIVAMVDIVAKYEAGESDSQAATPKSIYMVFEYLSYDLFGLLHTPEVKLTRHHLKSWMHQLLTGVHYLHVNNVLHRDLKTANVLISGNGTLKIADLGLARKWSQSDVKAGRRLTMNVVTLWYRAPELLLGCESYGPPLDVWSVGCIMLEMYRSIAMMHGDCDEQQIDLIFDAVGTPATDSGDRNLLYAWKKLEGVIGKPGFLKRPSALRKMVLDHARVSSWITDRCVKLLEGLLTMDPDKRTTANDALDNEFFFEPGMPLKKAEELDMNFGLGDVHECDARSRRASNNK